MKELLDKIRGRREATVEQMLMALDLVAGADLENRARLLAIATRGLADPRVARKWIERTAAEKDTSLRARMLARLAALDIPQIPDVGAYVRILADSVGDDATKPVALEALGRLASDPGAADALVAAYRGQRQANLQRLILWALAQREDVPDPIAALFREALDSCDADLKPLLLERLMRRQAVAPEDLPHLLGRDEPLPQRLLVLDHIVDRALPLDHSAAAALANDPSPACRLAAVRVLASRAAAEPLLKALRDPDAEVRRAAIDAFDHSIELTPAVIEALVAALGTARTVDDAQVILRLLTPHVARSEPVRAAFVALLRRNLAADVAIALYDTLGRLVPWDESFCEAFVEAYGREKHDRVRAAILRALSCRPDPDGRRVRLYQSALKAPDAEIRAWGLRGLLLVSMDEERCEAVAEGARVLLDRPIDGRLRLEFARKVACIPDKPAWLVAELKKVADQADDELKKVCQEAYDRAAKDVDWEQWHRRVDVEKDCAGVFPAIFMRYDDNPEAARRIMRAALAPDCSGSLYQTSVSAGQILDFLAAKDAIDDDLSRYCANFLLTRESNYGSPDFYLNLLKSNLKFAGLKDALWQILDKRADVNPVLLRELLVLAHDDEEVWRGVRKLALSKTTPKALVPCLRFIAGNLAWAHMDELLVELASQEKLLDNDNRRTIEEAFRALGREVPKAKKPGPGLADE